MKKLLITLSLICGVVLLSFCNADSFTLSGGLANSPTSFSIGNANYFNTSVVRSISIAPLNSYLCFSDNYYISASFNKGLNIYHCTATKTQGLDLSQDSQCTKLMTMTKTGSLENALFSPMHCFQTQVGYYYLNRDTTGGTANSIQFGLSNINTGVLLDYFNLNSSSCPTCPSQYTSLECQTEYNLIPISSVDHEYCESNDLCTLCDTPINTGDIQRSALFINTIQYPGGPIINLDLGDNLDYTYSTGNASVDITVGGYEIDEEYLNGVIDSQSYIPTRDDFTKVFSLFGSYGGLLVVCLFVILVFYFVKKLFK